MQVMNKKEVRNFAEIERFDDKLFVCDNGIVVDDRTQCPLKCPFGTTLRWSICHGYGYL